MASMAGCFTSKVAQAGRVFRMVTRPARPVLAHAPDVIAPGGQRHRLELAQAQALAFYFTVYPISIAYTLLFALFVTLL